MSALPEVVHQIVDGAIAALVDVSATAAKAAKLAASTASTPPSFIS